MGTERKKKIYMITILLITVLCTATLTLYLVHTNFFAASTNGNYSTYTPNLEGYTKVSVDAQVINNYGIVQLTGNCYRVIAYTEPWQAQSIENGLKGKINVRPNCHDMTKQILDLFGIKVIALKINEVRNNAYIGELLLQQGNKVLSLDVRPSDGTAIALRENAPIYIKNELLEEYGKKIC